MAPAGTNISIEREVFPTLVGRGLYGCPADGYWLDIGTPERYLQGTFDILEGNVSTEIGSRLSEAGRAPRTAQTCRAAWSRPAWSAPARRVAFGCDRGRGTVFGEDVTIGAGAHVESSVLLDGASVGQRSTVRGSIVGTGAQIGDHCHVEDRVVLGEGVKVGSDNVLTAGARIFPGVQLPEGAIKF